jgi:prepilin-type processing-associated H-X9-DG protein
MQCTNHLKQLGLAVHNYHDVFDNMPGGGNGPGEQRTAYVPMLPFFEESARYSDIASYENIDTNPPYEDRTCWKGFIKSLLCPSDSGTKKPYTPPGQTTGHFVPANYCFSEADYVLQSYGKQGNVRSPFGMLNSTKFPGWGCCSAYSFAAVTDGLSNTVFLSERCALPGTGANDVRTIKGGVAKIDAWNSIPQVCLNTRGVGGNYSTTVTAKEGSGSNFGYYASLNVFFHTVLAPNAPSCYDTPASPGTNVAGAGGGSLAAQLSPTSYHSGGVNVCFGDGSVHFVTETIDTGDLSQWFKYGVGLTAIGDSPFGVWGALGAMNDGKSVALP